MRVWICVMCCSFGEIHVLFCCCIVDMITEYLLFFSPFRKRKISLYSIFIMMMMIFIRIFISSYLFFLSAFGDCDSWGFYFAAFFPIFYSKTKRFFVLNRIWMRRHAHTHTYGLGIPSHLTSVRMLHLRLEGRKERKRKKRTNFIIFIYSSSSYYLLS